jgi:predicted negative regulator of RcsB-dependent stress response
MILSKIKQFVKDNLNDIILLVGVILISLLSFAAGYIAARQQEKAPLRFENPKHEIRNPKQYQITEIQNSKYILDLEIRI